MNEKKEISIDELSKVTGGGNHGWIEGDPVSLTCPIDKDKVLHHKGEYLFFAGKSTWLYGMVKKSYLKRRGNGPSIRWHEIYVTKTNNSAKYPLNETHNILGSDYQCYLNGTFKQTN